MHVCLFCLFEACESGFANLKFESLGNVEPGGGGGHSLIWPIRGRAAGQGMVFGLLCPEQGILFYANLS